MRRDKVFMRLALRLAAGGAGFVAPNPQVGAVIVKNGRVIGMGRHRRFGEAHAEVNALAACTESPQGATAYVTLEPCCHYGKQPPCTKALIKAGISRVVVGMQDPNPLVAGGGCRQLQKAGIQVETGVLEAECRRLNRSFCHYITNKTPYTTLKFAVSLDGKIAAFTGQSQWITSAAARHHVQQQRAVNQAIMVGVNTVLADDPQLTCRLPGKLSPLRIICDSSLRTPLEATVVQTARQTPTLLATLCNDKTKIQPYLDLGCRVWSLPPDEQGRPDLAELMRRLGAEGISTLLVEGGAEIAWSMLSAGLVQKVQAYIAPLLLGGAGAKTPIGGTGFLSPDKGLHLRQVSLKQIGRDFLIEGEIPPCSPA